jgi:hypothetical protein
MSFINLDENYFDHPKTTRLEGLIGVTGGIFPIRLWCWCAKYSKERGSLGKITTAEIEGILRWNGSPGCLVEAMLKVGFLERRGREILCHDWKKTQGHIIAFSIRGKRNIKIRWEKYKKSGNTTGITKRPVCDTPNLPNLTKPFNTFDRNLGMLPPKPTLPNGKEDTAFNRADLGALELSPENAPDFKRMSFQIQNELSASWKKKLKENKGDKHAI